MKCRICEKDCTGMYVIANRDVDGLLEVCRECYDDYINEDYNSLTKKVEESLGGEDENHR